MIRKISLFITFLYMVGITAAAATDIQSSEAEIAKPVPPPSATNLWFHVGEVVHYNVYWGIIHVGSSVVSTEWIKHSDGRTLLRIRMDTRSNVVVEKLYPVMDIQETLIDPETFLPVYNYVKSRQGRHVKHEEVRFDHANRKAYWESFAKGDKKEIDIDADCRDLITMMYFIRSQPVKIGKQIDLRVYTDEKMYDLFIKTPKKEAIDLEKYGEVTSILFEPEAAFDGLFVRKGKMYMWVSDDARRVCTKITATIPLANIRIILSEVTGPGDDTWVKHEEVEEFKPPSKSFRHHR